MSPPVAIIDANVVVSGLLTEDATAPTAGVLDAMLSGRIEFVVSVDVLAEYRRVLLRPKVARRHGLSHEEIDVILAQIAENAIVVEPADSPTRAPDPGDQHLWDLLASMGDAVLVTGDALLLSCPPADRNVLSPRAYVEGWKSPSRRSGSTRF